MAVNGIFLSLTAPEVSVTPNFSRFALNKFEPPFFLDPQLYLNEQELYIACMTVTVCTCTGGRVPHAQSCQTFVNRYCYDSIIIVTTNFRTLVVNLILFQPLYTCSYLK